MDKKVLDAISAVFAAVSESECTDDPPQIPVHSTNLGVPKAQVSKTAKPVPSSTDKSAMESKKFKSMLVGVAATYGMVVLSPVAVKYGIPPDILNHAITAILSLGIAHLASQGVIDSVAAKQSSKKKDDPIS